MKRASLFNNLLIQKRLKVESRFNFSEYSYDLKQVWLLLMENQYVLVSGKAGTGKSVLLRELKRFIHTETKYNLATLAPTGRAAVNIGGRTLHSWGSMGLAQESIMKLKSKFSKGFNKNTRFNMTTTDIILLDEVSMVDPEFFEKLSEIAKLCTGIRRPFGNIKIVFFGDFLQLPPVNAKQYLFETKTWRQMNVERYFLRHVYRQTDSKFVKLLNHIRVGFLSDKMMSTLLERFITPPDDALLTRICTYCHTVKRWNMLKLSDLDKVIVEFNGEFSIAPRYNNLQLSTEDVKKCRALIQGRLEQLQKNFNVPKVLHLCIGAQVMSRSNHSLSIGIVNGSMGIVQSLSPTSATVKFENGVTSIIHAREFKMNVGRTTCIVLLQLPLCLSWAISIHASQGMSISKALVDTASFENGQFYVGISRVRSLDGLYLTGPQKINIHFSEKAREFEEDTGFHLLYLAARYGHKSPLSKIFRRNSNIADINVLRLIKSFV